MTIDEAAGLETPATPAAPDAALKTGEAGFITTRLQALLDWGRRNSLWPMPFGTACCAIEMMATLSSRYDLARFGAEVIRFSPRPRALLIVSGRVCLTLTPLPLATSSTRPRSAPGPASGSRMRGFPGMAEAAAGRFSGAGKSAVIGVLPSVYAVSLMTIMFSVGTSVCSTWHGARM